MGHNVQIAHSPSEIRAGELAFFLSCGEIVPPGILSLNKHNLVVHASDLPQGKGGTPLTWQILEGKNEITVCLLEAADKVDSGDIYFKEVINFNGGELLEELHAAVGSVTLNLVLRFIARYPHIKGDKQSGPESFYKRRFPKDSEVSIDKTLRDLFNNLRIADNEKYPVFFEHLGQKYILKIYKQF